MREISWKRELCNPHNERSLLTSQAEIRWKGFPLEWLEASPSADDPGMQGGNIVLAMLDCGSALAEFRYGRKSTACDLAPGALGMFSPFTPMDHVRWACRDVRRIIVEVDPSRLSEPCLIESLQRLQPEAELEFRDPALSAVLRCMVAEVAGGGVNGPLYAESLSLGVALRLQQRVASQRRATTERGKLDARQLRRLADWIDSHLASEITLSELAQQVGFSPAHFVRLFRNTVGCAPYQYVLKIRLARARRFLLEGALPIVIIAAETGFASQSHLTTAFVRAYGKPPGQLRRQELSPSPAGLFPKTADAGRAARANAYSCADSAMPRI